MDDRYKKTCSNCSHEPTCAINIKIYDLVDFASSISAISKPKVEPTIDALRDRMATDCRSYENYFESREVA